MADEQEAPAPDRAVLLAAAENVGLESGSPGRARPARRRRSRASRSRPARAAARRAPRRPSRRSAGRSRPRRCAPARRAAPRAPAPGACASGESPAPAGAAEDERQREGDDRQTAAGHPRHCSECRYRRQVWASAFAGIGRAALVRRRQPADNRAGGEPGTRGDPRTARADRRAARRAGRRAGQPRAPRADAHRRLRLRACARGRALAARAAHVRARGRAGRWQPGAEGQGAGAGLRSAGDERHAADSGSRGTLTRLRARTSAVRNVG